MYLQYDTRLQRMHFADSGALWGPFAEPGTMQVFQDYRLIFNNISAITLHHEVLYVSRLSPNDAAWLGRHATKFTRRVGEAFTALPREHRKGAPLPTARASATRQPAEGRGDAESAEKRYRLHCRLTEDIKEKSVPIADSRFRTSDFCLLTPFFPISTLSHANEPMANSENSETEFSK
jgi:hypothetical protein